MKNEWFFPFRCFKCKINIFVLSRRWNIFRNSSDSNSSNNFFLNSCSFFVAFWNCSCMMATYFFLSIFPFENAVVMRSSVKVFWDEDVLFLVTGTGTVSTFVDGESAGFSRCREMVVEWFPKSTSKYYRHVWSVLDTYMSLICWRQWWLSMSYSNKYVTTGCQGCVNEMFFSSFLFQLNGWGHTIWLLFWVGLT